MRLLETTLIRVGNEVYAQENKSYGLTTMRNRHVEIEGTTIHFRFDGKSGVHHEIDLADRRLAGIVRKMRDLPGYHLFQYLDENNQPQEISSDDVNRYLQSVAGSEFTAKDFRTWAGTVLCAVALRDTDAWATPAEADKRVVAAVKEVAKSLGNTPAVCRKCYIHPNIINAYLDPKTQATIWQKTQQIIEQGSESGTLSEEEEAVLRLLKSTTVKN